MRIGTCFQSWSKAALVVLFVSLLSAGSVQASSINLKLEGLVSAFGGSVGDYGYGSEGLYLGDDWSSMTHQYTNWTWDNINMEIEMNGDATISGTMTRGDGSTWGLDIALSDVEFVGALAGTTSVYDGIIQDILATGVNGTGLEFGSLEMTLTAPYSTSVPLTGWTGFAMPDMGHENPAELHLVDGAIEFGAWYQRSSSLGCGRYCYNVGDTKAVAVSNAVPEPSAAIVFAVGVLVTSGAIRRRR